MLGRKKRKEQEEKNEDEIEVVIGDESVLNISEVNDCMNPLRPKDSVNNRKNFIIPTVKKKKVKKDSENDDKDKEENKSEE